MNAITARTEDQRDCLQEIVNVAMGQAGDSLARFLKVFIHLSVPRIRVVSSKELGTELAAVVPSAENVSAIRQGFYSAKGSSGLKGEAITLFGDSSFKVLADLLAYEEALDEDTE